MSFGRFNQYIPRPEGAIRHAETPWGGLDPSKRRHIPLDVVAEAFPSNDARVDPPATVRAAVLAGVVEQDGEAMMLLTRRSLDLDRDPGLVSFPGGYIEADEHPVDAALREAEEEIGLAREFVEVRQSLGTVRRARLDMSIVGYLGLVSPQASFTINRDEVDALFLVPLRDLLADGASWHESWAVVDFSHTVHFFTSPPAMADNLVWGITAKILWDVLVGVTQVLQKR